MSERLRVAVGGARAHRRLVAISAMLIDGARGVDNSVAFSLLHPYSLAFASITLSPAAAPAVNVVVPGVRTGSIFAGVRTALEFACRVAERLQLPLQVVNLGRALKPPKAEALVDDLMNEFNVGVDIRLIGINSLVGRVFATDDVWIGTHWTTAHPLDVACRLDVIAPARVIYLVQDYEPGFLPWSSEFALTRSTYHAGFQMVVNSTPLQRYINSMESLSVIDDMVFAPRVDLPRLQKAAELRRTADRPRVFFYGRPRKPRNLFTIGVAALHMVADDLHRRGIDADFISAGESHPDIRLSSRHVLRSLGKLPWDAYFGRLSEADVVFSLQLSPHPSHLPLDAVVSGAVAVTNEFGGTRAGLHARMLVAEADPTALSKSLLIAIERVRCNGSDGKFDPAFAAMFGRELSEVAAGVAKKFAIPGLVDSE